MGGGGAYADGGREAVVARYLVPWIGGLCIMIFRMQLRHTDVLVLETDRQTDRQRETERDRDRETETKTDREREREKRERERERERESILTRKLYEKK